jgi:hypothetical protein
MLKMLAKLHVGFHVKWLLLCNVLMKFSNAVHYQMSLKIHSAVFKFCGWPGRQKRHSEANRCSFVILCRECAADALKYKISLG